MFFAMCISILLGMGMPTHRGLCRGRRRGSRRGLVNLGIPLLTAHFFVFYFARGLGDHAAGRAGKLRRGRHIRRKSYGDSSVTSFKIGLVAFIVPFMFFLQRCRS